MAVATQATGTGGDAMASKRDSDKELADLVPLAADGSRRALQNIMRIIHPQVLRYCRARIGGNRQPTAEDVAQEICLAVATSISTYKDKGRPFMAYVYGIASHKVTDAHRALSRDQTHPTDEVPEDAADDATPEESVLVMDGSNRVRALLDTLSDKARDSSSCVYSWGCRQRRLRRLWSLPLAQSAWHSIVRWRNCVSLSIRARPRLSKSSALGTDNLKHSLSRKGGHHGTKGSGSAERR